METLTIREILEGVDKGEMRIPAFQRGFVWDPDKVAFLMDSIYKGYPFGALLFWQTRERLKFDRNLGPFTIPEPREEYPIYYILDGQQRITSIFGVFQSKLNKTADTEWKEIYFDFTKNQDAQEPMFFALSDSEFDVNKHFPLNTLFNPVEYRKSAHGLSDPQIEAVDSMMHRFAGVQIPVQVFRTEERSAVATIFERINRQGVRLDTLQLLSAWTWSEEFQLSDKFNELSEELEPFGFNEISSDDGGDNINLVLRCCAAILVGDASPESLMSITGNSIRDNFESILNGIKGAVDYFKDELNISSLANLPFSTLIVPLSVFFAVPGNKEAAYDDVQRQIINQWFWRSCFSRRYSSGVLRNLKHDIEEIKKLREGQPSQLGQFKSDVEPRFFIENDFGITKVNTKTFILAIATQKPLSFISGTEINLQEKLRLHNKAEFHHMMPRSFLKDGEKNGKYSINSLANFCFLSRADNRRLGGKAPSEYRSHMPKDSSEILRRALTTDTLFKDNYEVFIDERVRLLTDLAKKLCNN